MTKKLVLAAVMAIAVICFIPQLSINAKAAQYTEVEMETKDNTIGKMKAGHYFNGDAAPQLAKGDFSVKSVKAGQNDMPVSDVTVIKAGWYTYTGMYTPYTNNEFNSSLFAYVIRIQLKDGPMSMTNFKAYVDGVEFKRYQTYDSTAYIYDIITTNDMGISDKYRGTLNDEGSVRFIYNDSTKVMDVFYTGTGSSEMNYTDTYPYGNAIQENATDREVYRNNTKKIVVEDGVTTIGGFLFYGFKNVEEVDISDDVTSIGIQAFNAVDLSNSLETIKFPANLKNIGDNCFRYQAGLTEIVIPDSVETIGKFAFANCSGLKSVKLSSKIDTISEYMFTDCSSLEKIDIPEGVESIGEAVFDKCKKLKEVNLPSTLKKIDKNAFRECTSLKELTIPDSVTDIYGYNVEGETSTIFTKDYEVVIKANPGTIGAEYALQKSKLRLDISLATISGLKTEVYTGKAIVPSYKVYFGSKELTEGTDYEAKVANNIKVGTAVVDVTGMGKYAGSCYATFKIDKIDLSKAEVTGIEDKDFTGSPITQNIVVKLNGAELKEGTDYKVEYKDNTNAGTATVTITGTGVYRGTITKIFKINAVPEAAGKEITDTESAGLYTVVSGEVADLTVEYTGTTDAEAKTVTIPDFIKVGDFSYKVVSIKAKALKNNKKVTTVIIGSNVKVIGDSAFAGCTKLKKVDCKSKVLEKIGKSAFSGDKKLKSIILKTKLLKKSTVGKNAIKKTSAKLVIKAPKKSVKSYKKIFKAKGNKKVVVKK